MLNYTHIIPREERAKLTINQKLTLNYREKQVPSITDKHFKFMNTLDSLKFGKKECRENTKENDFFVATKNKTHLKRELSLITDYDTSYLPSKNTRFHNYINEPLNKNKSNLLIPHMGIFLGPPVNTIASTTINLKPTNANIFNSKNKIHFDTVFNQVSSHVTQISSLPIFNKIYLNSNTNIPQNLKEYISDIYTNYLNEERVTLYPRKYNYFTKQVEINEEMRSILIDWLIEVHSSFKMKSETLFWAISIIDRYLSTKQIHKSELQLLAISSLLIGSKYEELNIPSIKDLVYITNSAYSKENIIDMELKILSVLDFNILLPLPINFYNLWISCLKLPKNQSWFGEYLMECYWLCNNNNRYNYSVISCACVYLTMKLFQIKNYQISYDPYWFNDINTNAVKECAMDITIFLGNFNTFKSNFVKKKYSEDKYMKVAWLI